MTALDFDCQNRDAATRGERHPLRRAAVPAIIGAGTVWGAWIHSAHRWVDLLICLCFRSYAQISSFCAAHLRVSCRLQEGCRPIHEPDLHRHQRAAVRHHLKRRRQRSRVRAGRTGQRCESAMLSRFQAVFSCLHADHAA